MQTLRFGILCAAATCVCLPGLQGCASPMHIISPTAGAQSDPVTHVTVQFKGNFHTAATWSVNLNNGAAVSGFSPIPADGVTSTAPIDVTHGFKEAGTCDAHHDVLSTSATCGFFCVLPGETVDFMPPQLQDSPTKSLCETGGNVVEFATTAKAVYVVKAPSVPIHVTITDISKSHVYFQLGSSPANLLPPGAPLTVTIPAGGLSAPYFVKSVVAAAPYPAEFSLQFTAPGCSTGETNGVIVTAP
jgi:hypothetical protein